MACRGSERALGGVRPPGGREAISSSSRTQTDPHPSQGTGGAASLSVGGCQTEKGIVEWVTREPLLSTEYRAIPGFASWLKPRHRCGYVILRFYAKDNKAAEGVGEGRGSFG